MQSFVFQQVCIPPISQLPIYLLQNSRDKLLRKLWDGLIKYNKSDPDTFSANSTHHRSKLSSGKYALFYERSVIDDIMASNCEMTLTKDIELFPLQVAVGLQNRSAYRKDFSRV